MRMWSGQAGFFSPSSLFGRCRKRLFSSGSLDTVRSSRVEDSFSSKFYKSVAAVGMLGVTGAAAISVADDFYIYEQCSSMAVTRASQDPRMIQLLGEDIKRDRWHLFNVSLGVAHRGLSASCSFPVSGNRGSANLHLKAVCLHGNSTSILGTLLGKGNWEVLVLEAVLPASDSHALTQDLQRINLMQASDGPKAGDRGKGASGPCRSTDLQEV